MGIDISTPGGRYYHFKYGGQEYVRGCPKCGGSAVFSEGAIQYDNGGFSSFTEYDKVEILCFSCGKRFGLSNISKCEKCSCIKEKKSLQEGLCNKCLEFMLDNI